MNAPWVILTGEFPPGGGGVADYTAHVAASLAIAGDAVTVCRPHATNEPLRVPGVEVLTLPDHYGPLSRRLLAQRLDAARARVLVQYVPQAFGMRGANVAFCRWLHRRFAGGDDIRVMFHEPYFYITLNPGLAVLAAFQRAMAAILLRASDRIYLSTESWQHYLKPYARRDFDPIVLPIASTVPAVDQPARVSTARAQMLGQGASRLIGHFGSYGDHIAPLLADVLGGLLADPALAVLCIGDRSDAFVQSIRQRAPGFSSRIHATGRVPAEDVSIYLQCCDAVVQPYPDGVTTRRTTIMAALANGRPVVTTDGELTEQVWARSGAALLVPPRNGEALAAAVRQLLADERLRASLGARAKTAYAEHFSIERTVAVLRRDAEAAA